jgi:hypothetical protein
MPEIDYAALAAQAIQIKPAAEWECQALQCHFPIGYRDALHVMLILRPEEDQIISTEPIAPATAEGQPHEFDTDGTPGDAGRPDAPLGWHYGTRGASKGKLVRDVAPKPAAAKPKPPAPEPVPTSMPVDEPEPKTCPQWKRYKRLVDKIFDTSRNLRRLRNELKCATTDLILARAFEDE